MQDASGIQPQPTANEPQGQSADAPPAPNLGSAPNLPAAPDPGSAPTTVKLQPRKPQGNLAFVDDASELMKAVHLNNLAHPHRYFDEDAGLDQAHFQRCFNCGQTGHTSGDCTNAKRKKACHLCAQLGHEAMHCTAVVCLRCGRSGHRQEQCTNPRLPRCCMRCGDVSDCPCAGEDDIWRYEGCCEGGYSAEDLAHCRCYVCGEKGHLCCEITPAMAAAAADTPPAADLTGKEVPGSFNMSCYNCGSAGHLGEDCPDEVRPHILAERAGDLGAAKWWRQQDLKNIVAEEAAARVKRHAREAREREAKEGKATTERRKVQAKRVARPGVTGSEDSLKGTGNPEQDSTEQDAARHIQAKSSGPGDASGAAVSMQQQKEEEQPMPHFNPLLQQFGVQHAGVQQKSGGRQQQQQQHAELRQQSNGSQQLQCPVPGPTPAQPGWTGPIQAPAVPMFSQQPQLSQQPQQLGQQQQKLQLGKKETQQKQQLSQKQQHLSQQQQRDIAEQQFAARKQQREQQKLQQQRFSQQARAALVTLANGSNVAQQQKPATQEADVMHSRVDQDPANNKHVRFHYSDDVDSDDGGGGDYLPFSGH